MKRDDFSSGEGNYGGFCALKASSWYLKSTIVQKIFEINSGFIWNSDLREKFNFYFQEFWTSIEKKIILAGRLGTSL